MSSTIALTDKTFDAEVMKGGTLFIDFSAEWCAPCKAFAPIYEKAAKQHPAVRFGKVDVDADEALADEFDVQAIPTLVAIRDGVVVFHEEGSMPAKVLAEVIAGVQGLDMEEVRSHLEAEEAPAAPKKKKPAAKKAPAKKAAAPVKAAAKKAAPAKKKAPAKKPARR